MTIKTDLYTLKIIHYYKDKKYKIKIMNKQPIGTSSEDFKIVSQAEKIVELIKLNQI